MKHIKLARLGTAALLGFTPSAQAADWMTMPDYSHVQFTPHHTIYNEKYIDLLTNEQIWALNNYVSYELREPCQNYRVPPTGFYRDGCALKYRYPAPPVKQVAAVQEPSSTIAKVTPDLAISNIITSYEIHFGFDRSDIEPEANSILDQIVREISKYNPREVVVGGYTDRSGSPEYNLALSQRRALAVSDALNNRGVMNRTMDQQAHGEDHSAVNTNDGVRLRENRRVVVEFRK